MDPLREEKGSLPLSLNHPRVSILGIKLMLETLGSPKLFTRKKILNSKTSRMISSSSF